MSPTLIRMHNFEPSEPSTSTSTREAKAMHTQSALHSRSTEANSSSGSGGVAENTIIFIVVGVVCLLVILIGFYLVSRPRVAPNAAPSVPSSHPQHSPITHPPRPRCERGMSESWKIWKIWRHTSSTNPPTTTDTPVSQASPAPATITSPSRIIPARGSSKTYPPITPRPSQTRRVTSLSVTTSFSHSHITEEALNDFRASAYDLDGDLEAEMLNSARDDIWWGHPLAVEEGCGGVGVEEATPNVEGSAEGYTPSRPTTECGVGDYENSGACQCVASGSNGVEEDVTEVDKVAMGKQAL